MAEADLYTMIFSGIALVVSCLLLAVLYKTRRSRQRVVVWAAPMLMIGLATLHLFFAPGAVGFLSISILGFIIFFVWAYAYLGPVSFWTEANIGLGIAVIFSMVLMPWFFLYLVVKIYNERRGGRAKHVEKVWKEALGR